MPAEKLANFARSKLAALVSATPATPPAAGESLQLATASGTPLMGAVHLSDGSLVFLIKETTTSFKVLHTANRTSTTTIDTLTGSSNTAGTYEQDVSLGICRDADDNLFVFGFDASANTTLRVRAYTKGSGYTWTPQTLITTTVTTAPGTNSSILPVWCNTGGGTNGDGHILLAFFSTGGSRNPVALVIDAGAALTGTMTVTQASAQVTTGMFSLTGVTGAYRHGMILLVPDGFGSAAGISVIAADADEMNAVVGSWSISGAGALTHSLISNQLVGMRFGGTEASHGPVAVRVAADTFVLAGLASAGVAQTGSMGFAKVSKTAVLATGAVSLPDNSNYSTQDEATGQPLVPVWFDGVSVWVYYRDFSSSNSVRRMAIDPTTLTAVFGSSVIDNTSFGFDQNDFLYSVFSTPSEVYSDILFQISTQLYLYSSWQGETIQVLTGEGAKFPTDNFYFAIGSEVLFCRRRLGDLLYCDRAQKGTSASAHAVNDPVFHGPLAHHLRLLPERTVYTAAGSHTYNVPPGATRFKVQALGAGGGGGGGQRTTNTTAYGGSGGGGGGFSEAVISASDIGATLGVTVGTGGTAGATPTTAGNGTNGGAGGDTTVTSNTPTFTIVTGRGGAGGFGGNTGSGLSAGGVGWFNGGRGSAAAALATPGAPGSRDAGPPLGGLGGGGGGSVESATRRVGGPGITAWSDSSGVIAGGAVGASGSPGTATTDYLQGEFSSGLPGSGGGGSSVTTGGNGGGAGIHGSGGGAAGGVAPNVATAGTATSGGVGGHGVVVITAFFE